MAAPGTPAIQDGAIPCKRTFFTAVIVEDVVTESAPTLLPVCAKEAVICGDTVKQRCATRHLDARQRVNELYINVKTLFVCVTHTTMHVRTLAKCYSDSLCQNTALE